MKSVHIVMWEQGEGNEYDTAIEEVFATKCKAEAYIKEHNSGNDPYPCLRFYIKQFDVR